MKRPLCLLILIVLGISLFITQPSAASPIYNVAYSCVQSANITAPTHELYNLIIMVLVVILLILIIKIIRDNLALGVMVVGMLLLFAGSFLPIVLDAVNGVGGCGSTTDTINITGKQNTWIALTYGGILPGSQVTSPLKTNNTDYIMDYTHGRIMALSTGSMDFGG